MGTGSVRDQQRLLGSVLVWMGFRTGNRPVANKVEKFSSDLKKMYTPISAMELERKFPKYASPVARGDLGKRKFLHLPPVDRGGWMVPVTALEYDFQVSPQLWLQLALFRVDGGTEFPQSIGFRFEPAEPSGAGHDYWHAQPITHFVRGEHESELPGTAPWVNTRRPSFPLDARDAATLLVAALLSIYGSRTLRQLVQGADFLGELGVATQTMHWRLLTP